MSPISLPNSLASSFQKGGVGSCSPVSDLSSVPSTIPLSNSPVTRSPKLGGRTIRGDSSAPFYTKTVNKVKVVVAAFFAVGLIIGGVPLLGSPLSPLGWVMIGAGMLMIIGLIGLPNQADNLLD